MLGTKVIEERESKYNGQLRVVKTLGFGTYIQADGLTQSGGIVETFWNQILRKIKKSKHQVSSVLVLGLGGGTIVKLIKRYWSEAKITGIDIDSVIVELGKKYLGLNEEDVNIKIGDASKFTKKKYDLVIVDLYKGCDFPKKFEDEVFLKSLTKNNLVIINRLYFGDKRPQAVKFGLKLQGIFKNVEYYYPEANLMFICTR